MSGTLNGNNGELIALLAAGGLLWWMSQRTTKRNVSGSVPVAAQQLRPATPTDQSNALGKLINQLIRPVSFSDVKTVSDKPTAAQIYAANPVDSLFAEPATLETAARDLAQQSTSSVGGLPSLALGDLTQQGDWQAYWLSGY